MENNSLLNIIIYKTEKCKIMECKKGFKCHYYHSNYDKRRLIFEVLYYPILCKKQKCKEDKCNLSHNNYELFYHPLNYKKQLCLYYIMNKNKCRYQRYCKSAHSESELQIELLHYYKFNKNFFMYKFKTVFCPLVVNHNKLKCIYAHNNQDFRRANIDFKSKEKCKNWINNEIIDIYPCNYDCKKPHGWKELDFHYSNYKKHLCKYTYKKCKYQFLCPKLHLDLKNEKKIYYKEIKK